MDRVCYSKGGVIGVQNCTDRIVNLHFISQFPLCSVVIMVALCNRETIYIFMLFLSSFFLFSSPNLSSRRLDVYHTLAHGVALVRI